MIVMKNIENTEFGRNMLEMLGIGLVILEKKNSKVDFKILYEKGIGIPLIQDLMELYKEEIILKEQGNSIIPVNEFTFFMHFFQNKNNTLVMHIILILIIKLISTYNIRYSFSK